MRREMIDLLKSLSPFVGETGKTFIQLTTHLNNLMSGEDAKKTMHTLTILKPSSTLSAPLADGDPKSMEESNPFGLFLILILLILSTGGEKSALDQVETTKSVSKSS